MLQIKLTYALLLDLLAFGGFTACISLKTEMQQDRKAQILL
jgi:hypothetical protein